MLTNNGSGSQHNYSGFGQNINHGRDQNITQNFGGAGIDLLWGAIKDVGASHNAEQQVSRGECLEGTREEVLRIIRRWRIPNSWEPPICWLSGAAGVGKTSIAMTLAKSFEDDEDDGLVESFFFFRPDPKRNNPAALMLTIAHGLVVTSHSIRQAIDDKITADRSILSARFEKQFEELVLQPVMAQNLPLSEAPGLVVIIDGLDECSDEQVQLRILRTITSSFLRFQRFPLRFLICSRPESWICNLLDPLVDEGTIKHIVLDKSSEPARDIRKYFIHEFQEICRSSKYRDVPFPNPWPSPEQLDCLVFRSDGQFSYAATAVRFVKQPYSYPLDQLNAILAYDPALRPSQSTFHKLDCLYHVVLAANPNHDQVVPILAAIIVLSSYHGRDVEKSRGLPLPAPTLEFIELLLDLPPGKVGLTVRAMHSVLNIRGRQDGIRIYHTSFTDYLRDQTRSGDFYINETAQRHFLGQRWLQALSRERIAKYR
ncbi:hypothetical protein V5O48_009381 [Marasmius crinis-equi]|uniref:NACHT domain-containing protein n=1 Tax=Marasmius crinis-equi TaxID=585013 RepID=A0ABR3FBE6_9AGAR